MSNIEQRIIENEIEKSLGNDFSIEKAFDTLDIIKGKRAQLGEIREWRGGKFRRTTNGWERIKESDKDSRGSRDNGINDDLQVNHDTTASKKGENPMKIPEGVKRVQYENIILDRLDRPSIHPLTIDGKEWRVNREIDRSGDQWTPYYVFEGGDGKKYWDLNAGIRAHRSSSSNSNKKINKTSKGKKKYGDMNVEEAKKELLGKDLTITDIETGKTRTEKITSILEGNVRGHETVMARVEGGGTYPIKHIDTGKEWKAWKLNLNK